MIKFFTLVCLFLSLTNNLRVFSIAAADQSSEWHVIDGFPNAYINGCLGTAIGKRTILTAAHDPCGDRNGKIRVYSKYSNSIEVMVVNRVRGKPFISDGVDYEDILDISLLQIDRDLPEEYIMPISIEPLKIEQAVFRTQQTDGFGRAFEENISSVHGNWYEIDGVGSCYGDSGGGSFIIKNGLRYVIAVTSRTNGHHLVKNANGTISPGVFNPKTEEVTGGDFSICITPTLGARINSEGAKNLMRDYVNQTGELICGFNTICAKAGSSKNSTR